MPVVRLYANLRLLAGAKTFEVPGDTLQVVLQNLCLENEKLEKSILDEDRLRPFIQVMVNGLYISREDSLSRPLDPEDLVSIFPAIAGG